MTIKETHQSLIKEFEAIDNWDDRYSHIIKLGRQLPDFPEEYRLDKNKIEGCQSQVWMYAKLINGKLQIYADSDAMIVKGLIAILLRAYSGFTPSEIYSTSPDFIKEIGIDHHLSPTRKNGLASMLKQIKMYAFTFKALAI
ncbi:MAG: SufE family protein [Melioribacteraceae bacterium]|nr:SufE family protein [Melioribacteraceae bacterium]